MTRISKVLAYAALFSQPALSEPAPAPQLVAFTDFRQYSPFSPPSIQNNPIFLVKRQSCPANHTSCTNINAPNACCPSGQVCTHDEKGNIACCPDNYYCTGTIGASAASSTTNGGTSTSGTFGSPTAVIVGTVTVTSTAGVTGGTATTTTPSSSTATTGGAAGGGSTVPNAYYPFVYLPTSFANAAVCSQYYTSCQAQSTSCFNALVGTNGVTIGGLGGGTTQVGGTGLAQQSASSVCSSLSQSACYGIQASQCGAITSASGFVQANNGPRQTGCPGAVYAAAVGAAAGVVGLVV